MAPWSAITAISASRGRGGALAEVPGAATTRRGAFRAAEASASAARNARAHSFALWFVCGTYAIRSYVPTYYRYYVCTSKPAATATSIGVFINAYCFVMLD